MSSGSIAALTLALAACSPACRDNAAPATSAAPGVQAARPAPPAPAPIGAAALAAAQSASVEACADAWLTAHKRDELGDTETRAYGGGSPLFDERTGVRTDRVTYLLGKLPELRAACAPKDGG